MAKTNDFGLFGWDTQSGNLARSMGALGAGIGIFPGEGGSIEELEGQGIVSVSSLESLLGSLLPPRILILRVPAGSDQQLKTAEALALLDPDDVIIDISDSWFRDTSARARLVAAAKVHFMAVGLGASENTARPLLMAGGGPDAFQRTSRFFRVAGPVASLGAGPSGHFIKMVHAAVETAFGEIVREVQSLLQRGLAGDGGEFVRALPSDPLFNYVRPGAAPLSTSESNGKAGRWAASAARELGVPVLTLEAVSGARAWKNREALDEPFCQPHGARRTDRESLVAQAHAALVVAAIVAYTEGLALLATASDRFGLHVDIPETLRIWRGGVIGRGRLLDEIQAAFNLTPGLPNLLFDDDFSEKVMGLQELMRHALTRADEWNLATPALAAAVHYIDTFRDAWLPINLVQPGNFHWAPRSSRAIAIEPLESETEYGPITGRPLL